MGTACPIEIGKPVAMADVAESSGPARTRANGPADVAESSGPAGAGGPVVAGKKSLAVADRTGASGPRGIETGGPVITGT